MLYSAVPRSSQWPSIWTRAEAFALSQSALARNVARAGSESAALSNSKLISFIGPSFATSPLRKASRLESVSDDGWGAAAIPVPDGALGFSAVHFGPVEVAGVPVLQETKKIAANNLRPYWIIILCSLIVSTFPAPSWTD